MSSTGSIYRKCPCGETAHDWTGRRWDADGNEIALGDFSRQTCEREFACRNCRRILRSREAIYKRHYYVKKKGLTHY